jgi:hypothetical protein
LRVEVVKLNEHMKSPQALKDVFSYQRSSFDKTGLGYIDEASCKEDAHANFSKRTE